MLQQLQCCLGHEKFGLIFRATLLTLCHPLARKERPKRAICTMGIVALLSLI